MLGTVGEPQVSDLEESGRNSPPKGQQLSGAGAQLERAAGGGRTGCSSAGNRSAASSLPNRLLPVKVLCHWTEAADELIVPFP